VMGRGMGPGMRGGMGGMGSMNTPWFDSIGLPRMGGMM
jgi:hypothetical protein